MLLRSVVVLATTAVSALAAEYFNPKVGQVEDFPREVRRSTKLVLRGTTRGAYRNAELIIIAPKGRTFLNKDNKVADFRFTFTVAFEDGVGPYRMEIMAHAPNSIRSIARFTVWHGMKPRAHAKPPPPEGPPTPATLHPRLLEKRWLRTLNDFRTTLRLKPVRWNDAVSARAREHAKRMAKARYKIHKFPPYGGIVDMLRRDGAGKAEMSGPADPWPRVNSRRPFPLPAPQPRGPRVWNHVVPFVQADDPKLFKDKPSLRKLFEATFVREAAFRICAADPNCVEVGVGIARPPRPAKYNPKKASTLRYDSLFYSIGFVQINDRTVLRGQQEAYADLLRAAAGMSPDILRALGRWGRGGKAATILKRALKDKRPTVSSAAFDGLLLLDEAKARKLLVRVDKQAKGALGRRAYTAAVDAWRPFRFVTYDEAIREAAAAMARNADQAGRKELAEAGFASGADRTRRLESLLARVEGLPLEAKVRAELAK